MDTQLFDVEVSIKGSIVANLQVTARTAEEAEDAAADLIKLEAKKAYAKGSENDQNTEDQKLGSTEASATEEGSLPEAEKQ